MSEWITVTIKEIHCIERSEFKGRSDEIYLKQRDSHEWLWPTGKRAERIKAGHALSPGFHYYYSPNDTDATLELWEHDKITKDDFLGSITFDSESQGEHTHFMNGDGGSYRVVYSVNNPYKKQLDPLSETMANMDRFSGTL